MNTTTATTKNNAGKVLQKIQKEIEKRNAVFKKATKAQKRVLIAEDVIAQIKANRLIPESGVFVEANINKEVVSDCDVLQNMVESHPSELAADSVEMQILNRSLRESFFDKTVETCSVCALGGIFMSCTLFNNKTLNKDVVNHTGQGCNLGESLRDDVGISNGLDKLFTMTQLVMIENAFECGEGYFYFEGECKLSDKVYNACVNFGNKYDDAKDRLVAIMKNIIKNNGTFKP